MDRTRKTAFAWSAALLLNALQSADGYAASASQTEDNSAQTPDGTLERILVTAQRREESLQEVPVAITVLSGEKLAWADAIKTANDVVQFVPNASAAATDGRTRPRWFLRGVGTNDTGANTVSPIGIYNDEVYLNNVYIQGFPLFDLERVEVLRGPQGSLWGKNTTGGAIHFISRKPEFNTNGYARLTYGSYNERAVQGALGGSISDDNLAGRLSFYNEKRDGWVTNLYSGREVGAVSDQAARLQLLATPDDEWEILFNYHTRKLDGDKNPSNYFADPSKSPPYNFGYEDPAGIDVINQVGDPTETGEADGGSVRLNWQGDGYDFTAITAYEEGSRILTGGSAIPVDNARSYAQAESEQWSQEFRLASPTEQAVSWILGAFYFSEELISDTAAGTVADLPATVIGRRGTFYERDYYQQDTSGYALFASLSYTLTEQLTLSSGLRYSSEKKQIDYLYQVGGPRGSVAFVNPVEWWLPQSVRTELSQTEDQNQDQWDELTYDLTPSYQLTEQLHGYFRYAHGFRAGGFAISDTHTVNSIDPEIIDSYELGLKSSWLDDSLTLNSALFYYDYSDIQVLVLQVRPGDPNAQAVLQNAGTGYVKGAEFELESRLQDSLKVRASVGLLRTEYTDFPTIRNGNPDNAKGNAFSRAPELSGTFELDYQWAFRSGATLHLIGDLSYRSKQYFNAVTQDNALLEQAGYSLANARLVFSPAGRDLEFIASVRNLADKEYAVLATGPSNNSVRRVFGLPRSYALSVTVRF
jgi:iron complex outermembrane receptor protein